MDIRTRRRPGAGPLGLPVLLLLAACGHEADHPVLNKRPSVMITGGPLSGSTMSYTARIFWSGWDDDGTLTHFQYAVDPPADFSPEEIASPETRSGIGIQVVPGPGQFVDTLRVGKLVDGALLTFDWVQTREFSRSFSFRTTRADSFVVGGRLSPANTWSAPHVVYVRARDNDGNYSEPDRIAFTATTYVPSSQIIRPDIEGTILNLGKALTLTWDGLDPDSPEAQKKPVGYVYKLLRLDTLEPPIPVSAVTSPKILYDKGDPEWIYRTADTPSLTLHLGVPGQYVFGVRAVDVAGAVEPLLNFGRNAFRFQASETGGRSTLTLCEPILGCFTYRGIAPAKEAEVPSGRKLRFTWHANADEYGGIIEAYSWGIDLPDLDREGPGSGWSAWGMSTGNFEPIVFDRSGIHVLYVRARDQSGAITLGTLIMNVTEFPLDKELLFVDDSFDDLYPRDVEHDAFWRGMVQGYPGNPDRGFSPFTAKETGEHHAHLDNDRGALSPVAPSLTELGRYKLVVWENRGSGYDGTSALLKVTDLKPVLSAYLGAGGSLWLGGRMTVGATLADASGIRANLEYPKTEIKAGDFAYDFLKLHSSRINNDKAKDQQGRHNIYRAIPFPGRPEVYPPMEVNLDKLNLAARLRGVSHADAVFDPMFDHSEPDFRGRVDSLYVYGTTAVHLLQPPGSSTYENRLVAVRWHDPDPNRQHGRIQWFGFPLYFFYNQQTQETFNRSIDWFREETKGE